jgi:hypothetical protein
MKFESADERRMFNTVFHAFAKKKTLLEGKVE